MKVLLITHNPFSTYQSMGKTFLSLFSAFEKEALCQLYVYPSFPDVEAVKASYRITDRDAIKRILPFLKAGGEVSAQAYTGSAIENKMDKKIFGRYSNNQPAKRLLRDFIWKISSWYSRDLQRWLDREKPDCIFLAPGYAKFIYDIAFAISEKRNIPIITYICDDNYFLKTPKTFIGRLQLQLLQRKTRRLMESTCLLVAISEEIAQQYSRAFSVKSEVIMTGASFGVSKTVPERTQINRFSFFGNLDLNRDKSLADIGRALDRINQEHGTECRLCVYTGDEIPAEFADIRSIEMGGFLVGEDFQAAFRNTDCLVHVEAFDEVNMDIVKGSVSTKIADSLASGIPLLAYGPAGIASMEHLKRNDCAFVANAPADLKSVVEQLLTDRQLRDRISQNALSAAQRYHVTDTNSKRLKAAVKRITEAL